MSEVFSIGAAIALGIGIGIQNFPEGFAVSMPLRRQGVSRWNSWKWGQMSAIVEPIFAVIGFRSGHKCTYITLRTYFPRAG